MAIVVYTVEDHGGLKLNGILWGIEFQCCIILWEVVELHGIVVKCIY